MRYIQREGSGANEEQEVAMGGKRFKQIGMGSFFGDLVYREVIPPDHFLVKLKELVPWGRFTEQLIQYYRGGAEVGRPPYDPAVILRMLLVSYLYNVSERQVEEMVNYHLPMKYFVGLAVNERAPDHSTLTAFKRRLEENGHVVAFQEMLQEIVVVAGERGIEFGQIQVLDSVHTVADVNTQKDETRQKKEGKGPRDASARWGAKHSRQVKTSEGKTVKQAEYFYGYKGHVSLNSETELFTSVRVTEGNRYDGHELPRLLESDLAQGIPVQIVSADRGYDDSDNHYLLTSKGIQSAIRLKRKRTEKKDRNKGVWVALKQSEGYRQGLGVRYKVERKFGEAKEGHGLRRCRYLGLVRYYIQVILTVMALNLKRMVKLVTGVPFKGRAIAV
jgi:IS5 family transposase